MTKEEFIALTGMSDVTDENFEIINDMYMRAGDDFDKVRFCDDFKAHRESTIMYRFYTLLKDVTLQLQKANERAAKAESDADMYKRWWHEEEDKTEKQKLVFEEKLQNLQDLHETFKAKTIEFVKLTAEML